MTWEEYRRTYPYRPRRTKLVRRRSQSRILARMDRRRECLSDAPECPESDGSPVRVAEDLDGAIPAAAGAEGGENGGSDKGDEDGDDPV